MPHAVATFVVERFREDIRRIIIARGKVASEELNKRVIQVLIGAKGYQGAVHLTRKATEARIRKDLNKTYHVAGRLERSATGRITKSGSDVKLIYILASKRITENGGAKGLTFEHYRQFVGQVAQQIYEYRIKSRAYLAAGWLAAAHDLMEKTPGNWTGKASPEVQVRPGHKAAESWAEMATPSFLSCAVYNTACDPGTVEGDIAMEGIEKGMAEQIRDMESHLEKMLEKSAQNALTKV